MEKEYCIRAAMGRDCDALAEIKASYVRSLYRGVVPAETLKGIDATPYRQMFAATLEAAGRQIVALENGDALDGFVIMGADPETAGYGMIFDAAIRPGCDPNGRDMLLEYAIRHLNNQGMENIHTWILRENFRVRFLYERFGFKAEGVTRTVENDGHEMRLTRYLYRYEQPDED